MFVPEGCKNKTPKYHNKEDFFDRLLKWSFHQVLIGLNSSPGAEVQVIKLHIDSKAKEASTVC